jgi:hypothetical protein
VYYLLEKEITQEEDIELLCESSEMRPDVNRYFDKYLSTASKSFFL